MPVADSNFARASAYGSAARLVATSSKTGRRPAARERRRHLPGAQEADRQTEMLARQTLRTAQMRGEGKQHYIRRPDVDGGQIVERRHDRRLGFKIKIRSKICLRCE